jgi:protein arginine kinase
MRRDSGIIVSSRVRLARNVRTARFPGWASETDRVKLCSTLRDALSHTSLLKDSLFIDMAAIQPAERDLLRERHLISKELVERGRGGAVVISADESLAVMINEEDHLRMQGIARGLDLVDTWRRLNGLDTELEELVEYAYSSRLGYITACPSNVGTGLRASAMLHLPGLKLLEEVDALLNGLEKLGFAVRGIWGEGSDAWGNMYQISNLSSLGESEATIVEGMMRAVQEVVVHEENARERMMESRETFFLDHVGRALGILANARILSSKEAIELLSVVRLGVEMDRVRDLDAESVGQMMLLTQPGHLQKIAQAALEPEKRDEMRANMIRRKLGHAAVVE